ncbi:MAG: hypothetical protein M3458_11590 [Acidobacteriota bacterium]|nr:hypothetical protein [Acidobacteriota bacterium]
MKIPKLMTAVFVLQIITVLGQDGACPHKDNTTMPTTKTERAQTGTWGGQGARLDVIEGGGTVEFDCAHGTISEPLVPDENGHFEVRGTYVRERGGPVRIGAEEKGQPVVYIGDLSDQKLLTLTIKLADSKDVVATYTVTHGKNARLRKCL